MLDIYRTVSISGVESGIPFLLERRAVTYGFSTTALIDPPLAKPFVITPEGVTGSIASFLGFKDVEIGDAEFDKKFRIGADEPDFVKRLLTTEVKAALVPLLPSHGFRVSESAVVIDQIYPTNMILPEHIVQEIPKAIAVVRALKMAAVQGYR